MARIVKAAASATGSRFAVEADVVSAFCRVVTPAAGQDFEEFTSKVLGIEVSEKSMAALEGMGVSLYGLNNNDLGLWVSGTNVSLVDSEGKVTGTLDAESIASVNYAHVKVYLTVTGKEDLKVLAVEVMEEGGFTGFASI